MKKLFKITLFFSFFLLFLFVGKVNANSISSINMYIYVNSSGNANVQEVWTCYATQGTEVYHPYYNLGNSKIKNLSVSDNGTKYTTLSNWNTSGSLSSKAKKCGINNISNGVEICWGITSYGSHVYTVNYTITNFVSKLTDSQMAYWTLIPYDFSESIGKCYIKIYSDFDYPSSLPVWGYGNEGGTCYVYNGYIEFESNGALSKDEYMTILVKFPTGTFSTLNNISKDFDYYYNMAENGSTKYNKSSSSSFATYSFIIALIIIIIFYILGRFKWFEFYMACIYISILILLSGGTFNGSLITPIMLLAIISFSYISQNTYKEYAYGSAGSRVPRNVPLYRDIPCNGNVFRAYFIAYNYNLMKNKTDFLGVLLLKWLKEGKVKVEKTTTTNLFNKEKEIVNILFNKNLTFTNKYEQLIYNMLYEASVDGKLESKEVKKWCSKHYSKILIWFDRVLAYERDLLIGEKLIHKNTKKFSYKKYVLDNNLMQEARDLKGLKKFLTNYTLIDKREAIEVSLFEDYLIFAQLLGIANKVSSQFKELYPDIIENLDYDYTDIFVMSRISNIGIRSATSARSRAQSYNRYSSGGGGFSSGGGRWWLFWPAVVGGGGFR